MPAVRAAREDTFGVELRGPADAPAPAAIRLSSVDDGRTFYRGQAPITPLGIVDDQAIGRATIIDREVRQRSDFFEVRALDAAGLDSRPFGVRLSPPAVVELGEACDPAGAWSRCADGLRCPDAAHGEPYVCEAPDDRCPADWTVHDVNPHPQGDRWVVFGERRDDDLAGLSSACAPPAPVARI